MGLLFVDFSCEVFGEDSLYVSLEYKSSASGVEGRMGLFLLSGVFDTSSI